jgi:hypothetical protein
MKRLLVAGALGLLVAGGYTVGGHDTASAASSRTCVGAWNMVGTAALDDSNTADWNFGMVNAMSSNNANGDTGMLIAVTQSTTNMSQTPPCQ